MKKSTMIMFILASISLAYADHNEHSNHHSYIGPQGPKGDKGNPGQNGAKGDTGDKGETGAAGVDGKDGLNGKDGQSCDSQTKVIGEIAVRLHDSRKFEVNAFDKYDFRGGRNHEIGLRLTYKLGKSYEEQKIERLEKIVSQLMTVAHEPRSIAIFPIQE